MELHIRGYDLPGKAFDDGDDVFVNVHVGVQVGPDADGLVGGDAQHAAWALELRVVHDGDGCPDFLGPAVHGRKGDRFVYLTWGELRPDGRFNMFRRAKLMLDRVDRVLVSEAERPHRRLVATVDLSDGPGTPRCARVDPPAVVWTVEERTAGHSR